MSHINPGASVEFQDIPHSPNSSLLHPDTGLSDHIGSSSLGSSSEEMLPTSISAQTNSNASFYQLEYYQHYFDVTTAQMRGRLFRALIPYTKFYHDEDSKPDLYGPFWITSTLIFLLAAGGNFANYLSFLANSSQTTFDPTGSSGTNDTSSHPSPSETMTGIIVWSYNFQKVSVAASVFYCWISILPLVIYCTFSRMTVQDGVQQKGLVEIASLFGYSLVTFLPVCILCIPPIALLRWISVGVAFLWSSYFLIKNLGADPHNKAVFPVVAGIIAMNLGIALLTKFYFFDF